MGAVRTATLLAAASLVPTVHRPARPVTPPPAHVLWQYQLQAVPGRADAATGGIDLSLCARTGSSCARPAVYDIDLYGPNGKTPNAAAVAAIRRAGGYAICYVDAGTWENWRPDAKMFPHSLLGLSNGWPGERWLDIRRPSRVLPLMAARVAKCARAGFQGVEFDNVDAYANRTGFQITFGEQLRYNRDLARLAHRDGLAAGLKNDYGQVRQLVGDFNFAVDEQCVQYRECRLLRPFVAAGKAVFDVEYRLPPSSFCRPAEAAGVSAIFKSLALWPRPWAPCMPATRPAAPSRARVLSETGHRLSGR
jgi:hypothetical protein